MTTTPSEPVAAPQEKPQQERKWRNRLLIILSLGVIAILLGWQLLSVRTANTDPTIVGHPLSNPQMHLHTLAIGGKPGTLYLGTHYGIFTSSDGGKTWPQARGVLNTLMVTTIVTAPQDTNLMALVAIPSVSGGAPEGAYFSSDAGRTWTLRNPPGLSASAYPYTIQAGTGNSGHFYAFYLNAGWFETLDIGLHWHALAMHNLPAMQTPQLLSFAHNPNHLLLGGEQGLFESNDDGQNWHALTSVQGYVMSLVASKTTPTSIFCATDQGLFSWQDGSSQIKQLPVLGTTTFSRLAINATGNILYALAGQNLEYSQDGGVQWVQRKHFSRSDMTALVIDPQHAEKLYIGFFLPPQVIASNDSGKSWQILTGSGATTP
jgi:photosystem II stability/assembly factor-like uncharacterized protein